MRVLFVSQYFPPEIGAPSARTFEHVRQWVVEGHEVTVLTGFPNHPTGIIPAAYRGKIFQSEDVDGIRVWRTWLYATRNERFTRRTLSYLSFMFSAIIAASFRRANYDVVIATSPQFFVAIAGYVISRLKRKPLTLEIRDLWPEGIVAVGLLKPDSLLTRVLESIERFLYRKASCIITVTESFREAIAARGIDIGKIHTVRNGADLRRFTPAPRDNEIRRSLGLKDEFLVCYIGTHGMTQGLQTVLEAAARLRGRADIRFLFVGEGAEKPALIEQAKREDLLNVTFLEPEPKERVPLIIAASDTCLVPLKKRELFEGTIPSKMFEIMACARPVVLGVKGEAERILSDARGGIAVEPESAIALTEALERLADDPSLARELGDAGASYVRSHFDRSVLAGELIEAIEAQLDPGVRRTDVSQKRRERVRQA